LVGKLGVVYEALVDQREMRWALFAGKKEVAGGYWDVRGGKGEA